MMGFSLQFYILTLYMTKLNGNKFVNSIIFGLTRAIAIFAFGAIMGKMSDMVVFRIVFAGTLISNVLLIGFPDGSVYLSYVANCFYVASLGGW